MARINNYIKDDIVEPTDIVIGTEKSTGKTKNYSIDSIRNFFVTETNVGGIIFKKGNHLVSGEFTANSNYFSGVTEFKFNKTNTQGDSVIPIFNTLKTNLVNNRFTINVEDSTNQNRFILAKILNIIDNDTFFTITLDIVKNVGNGELVTGNNFSIEVGLYTEAIDGTKITTVTSNKVGNVTTVTVNGDFDNAPLIFEILDGDATSGLDWSNLLNIPISFPPSAHTHQISDVTSLQSNLDGKVGKNANIVAGTKTKITYDVKGLVTAGADATTADIADSLNKRYVTDADLVDIGNLSGVNTGDQNLSGYELLSNKQNSLVVDGSGIKYPTVDAVNAGIAGVNTNKVPYTGATQEVNIGANTFRASNIHGTYIYANPLLQLPSGGYITVNGNGADYFKGTRGQQWTSDIKIKYATDLSGSYDSRTLIDKGYLDTRLGSTGTGFELTSNKVTSLSGASTDVQYPSAKLTYDQLALKDNVSNKQNSLAFDGTGAKYPTVDAIKAINIPAEKLGNSTFTSVQHIQDLFHSAGWTSGGVITNAGGGLITVSAGTGLIRATNSDVATIYFTDFPASTPANVVLVDGSQNYIYVEYNGGTPRVIATTIQRADYNTSFLIGAVYRVGTTLHINSTVKTAISDHAQKMIAFNKEVMPYARANGSMISEVATRGFAITAGTFWNGLVRFTTNAFSTATGSFFYFYRNGVGGWTKVPTQTQINNTQFDNGTGTLGTLSNNKYGIHWVFIDTDGDTYVVYGQGDYTLIEAQNKMVPASLPVEITSHGFVVGKIIIQKSLTTFAQIESAFAMGFSSAMASEHNSLAGLQGGATGDYQHLTATQATIATQEATNTLSGYVSAGTQTFGGVKTFNLSPIVPTPTTNTQVTNKSYVDAKVADTITDGVTTIAPSQNAVFDALVLKEPANANIQAHISSTANPHAVTKTQVGLSNVDNTSDASKPVSTATQTALDGKLNNTDSAVTSKLLTGLNITGGTIVAGDSILQGFGKLQNLINGLLGGSIFQTVWNAATNSPNLTSSVGTKGHYYIVNVDGATNLNGITDWKVGDWAIFDGSVWRKVDNTDAVISVNGYTGAVNLVTGDIFEGAGSIGGRPNQLFFTEARARAVISDTITGINYNASTGILALDSGYFIPTTTEQTTWNNKQNALTNPITGTGTTNYLPKFTGTGVIGNSQIFDNGTNVGIGTTATTARFGVQGITAMDLPTYGSEFLLSTGWTSVGWTGDFATGFTHTTGNTSVLSNDKVAVNATRYQIAYTVTNRTAGSFTVSFGGQSNGGITATGTFGPTATSTANLTITPTSDFNGTIVISIRAITGTSTPIASYLSSNGTVRIEVRVSNASGNTFIGIGAGGFTTTGGSNSFFGLNAGFNATTGGNNSFFGVSAGNNTTTGSSNSFFGVNAGFNATTGGSNSFFGLNAGFNATTGGSNSFFGLNAGLNTTTGGNNSFFGRDAGANTTTGGNNSFFGRDAGRFIADGVIGNLTGGNSVFLGEGTRALADAQTNQIVIGQGAIGNGSNTATLGNTSVTRTILRGNVETNGSVKVADDTASASVSKVGAIRYRTTANSSIVEMCMQTGESSYQWQTIVTNTW